MTEETASVDYAKTSMMTAGSSKQTGGRVCFAFVPEPAEKEQNERDVYSVSEHLAPKEDEEYAEGALIASVIASEIGQKRHDPATGEEVST